MDRQRKLKVAVVVLAVLFGISLVALAATLIHNHQAALQAATVTVPENLIAEEMRTDSAKPVGQSTVEPEQAAEPDTDGSLPAGTRQAAPSAASTASGQAGGTAVTMQLYSGHPADNTPFSVGNMFPGDWETKYFCIRVSHDAAVTVHFRADVRPGYEKLAEVMKCRVVLLTTGETLYDGLMRDMPEAVSHPLVEGAGKTDELYYEIDAYLDTSVGSEYMEKDLAADFRWWVDEPESLVKPPQTGDASQVALWAAAGVLSLAVMLFLVFACRRKEEQDHERAE